MIKYKVGWDIGFMIYDRAKALGFLNLPYTILFASASATKSMPSFLFSTYEPNSGYIIWKYLKQIDDTARSDCSSPGRNKLFFYLAERAGVFVEVENKVAGFSAVKGSNHMLKIVIYCNNNEIIKGIARSINGVFKNGVINDTNWDKISQKFNVDIGQCITTWKTILL